MLGMRVLFFVGSLAAGGLERFVTRVSLQAKSTGAFEPVVCCLTAKTGIFLSELEAAQVSVWEAPKGWERRFSALIALGSLVREIEPDIVHSQVNFSLLQQVFAVRFLAQATFCVTERNCYRLSGVSRLKRLVQFHALRLLRIRYSANSYAVAEHLGRLVLADKRSIPILPNGVAPIPPNQNLRVQKRTRLGWGDRDIGIGYIARMAKHKGHSLFLRSVARVRDAGAQAKVCFLGDGPQRGALEKLTRELELDALVSFIGTVSDVEDWLQAFDIVVLLSSHEGMPNVILEAMAAGKPIIGTPVGAIPELLNDGSAGILVMRREVTEVAQALVSLIRTAAHREQLGQAASSRAREQFGLEVSFSKLLAHYEQTVA